MRPRLSGSVSHCLRCQALRAASWAFQGVFVRTIAFRIVSSLRMQAVSASVFGLPAARSRV